LRRRIMMGDKLEAAMISKSHEPSSRFNVIKNLHLMYVPGVYIGAFRSGCDMSH
jgi:hypothetical protein